MLTDNFAVYRENLSYADSMTDKVNALREAQYHQICTEAKKRWHGAVEPDRIAALYHTGDPTADAPSSTDTALCTPDFARFCRRFSDMLPPYGLFDTTQSNGAEDDIPEGQPCRTAYMQNRYTDLAWRQFAQHVPQMTAEYFSSYAAVCEELYNEQCPYGILPIYTSTDGHLISFRKLISKYDLKICLETDVELADESVMRFVLLRRKLLSDGYVGRPSCVTFSAVLSDDRCIGSLLTACEALGAVVTSVYTIPLAYGDRSQEYSLELDMQQGDMAALSLFLEASQLRYTVVGLYDIV